MDDVKIDQDRRAQWLRGVLDLCAMGLLAEGEAYGYQLTQRLADRGLGVIKGGTLYPILLRLERTGLVASAWRDGQSGPARKYYELTPEGRTVLDHEADAWTAFAGRVSAIVTGDRP